MVCNDIEMTVVGDGFKATDGGCNGGRDGSGVGGESHHSQMFIDSSNDFACLVAFFCLVLFGFVFCCWRRRLVGGWRFYGLAAFCRNEAGEMDCVGSDVRNENSSATAASAVASAASTSSTVAAANVVFDAETRPIRTKVDTG